MPIVNRRNKEALTRAIDIFLDRMRPFFIDCLGLAPGATVQIVLEKSLKDGQAENFAKNLRRSGDLESAIEVSFFETLASTYWEDIFSTRFGGEKKILLRFRKITWARNEASHPRHLRDLDEEFTRGSLVHIAYVLRKIRAWEEQQEVVRIRDGLEVSTWSWPEAERVSRWEAEKKAKEADAARIAAEKRARIAEAAHIKTQEQRKADQIIRKRVEERVCAAEAARQEAEGLSQGREVARLEAVRRAQIAKTAQLDAEKRAEVAVAKLRITERRAREALAERHQLENRSSGSQVHLKSEKGGIQPNLKSLPVARQSPRYEIWLIGEILSGRISRTKLRQHHGDTRIDGRLVHYVQAASSNMSPAAWKNYVVKRQEALHRGGTLGDVQRGVQRYQSHQAAN